MRINFKSGNTGAQCLDINIDFQRSSPAPTNHSGIAKKIKVTLWFSLIKITTLKLNVSYQSGAASHYHTL